LRKIEAKIFNLLREGLAFFLKAILLPAEEGHTEPQPKPGI